MRRIDATKRSLLSVAAVALTAAAVSACGHEAAVGADRTLDVALTEYRVIPQSVHAKPGQLMIDVRNSGRLTHNLTISRGATVVAQTPPISPGTSVAFVIAVTPGQYLIASTLQSDQTLGVYGTLTVG